MPSVALTLCPPSKSMTTVLLPDAAICRATETEVVVLPTPPFPQNILIFMLSCVYGVNVLYGDGSIVPQVFRKNKETDLKIKCFVLHSTT